MTPGHMMIYIKTKVLKENINLWRLTTNGDVENVMENM